MSYLALYAPADQTAAEPLAQARELVEQSPVWQEAGRTGDLTVWTTLDERAPIRRLGETGFVIGEVYDACDGRVWPANDRPPSCASGDVFEHLCSHAFGRYVAICGAPAPAIFRDPSGGLDCLVWQIGPLTLACDKLEQVPTKLQPPRLAMNWDVLAFCAASASLAMTCLALEGLSDVMPGTSRSMIDLEQTHTHWTPSLFVKADAISSGAKPAEELAARVDIAVRALIGGHERLVAEVSGGLDSAIVAGSIARLGLQKRVVSWLNYFADRPESDERRYAFSVTDAMQATLSSAHLPIRPLAGPDFTACAKGVRPGFNALVPTRDEDTASRMRELGASALVSGQGGDAIFYQMPSALLLSDELGAQGPRALVSPLLPALARRLRKSIWSVLAEASKEGRPPRAHSARSITALPREAARLAHPWISAAAKLRPAKRLQIVGLANAQVATGHCRISDVGSLLYPLTAQPVVEFCLGLPTTVLTAGGEERGLAREAFADRVPAMIRARRKKGELTAFHAKTVAASLDYLRPLLLEGCLAQAGVLNRAALETALKPDQLLWHGEGSEIFIAAALEAWVRRWQCYVPDSSHSGRRQLWAAGAA